MVYNEKSEVLFIYRNKKWDLPKGGIEKGEEIEDEAILRIGQTYQELTDYNNALSFYQQIIDNHSESIYRDEALFFSAEIYNKHLNQPEKAKPLYEAVLFNHQDSIHFVEARKNFRQLRGDSNL